MGALSNIRVLDLTRVLAGPYCTMMLADMGAEVIKIEIPGKGDDTRNFGPYKNKSSMYYANVNRNKKGVSLNMKAPEGKQLFLEMVKTADMVVENYRPGVMDKLGLGYDVLKEVNPRIIYGAVSGFGCYGPYSERPGYDIIAQAMGGLMSITGPRGGKPCRSGSAMGDVLGGMNLTIGLLAALNARSITGMGQRVDVALVDSVVSSLETGIQRYLVNHEIPERMGNEYAATYPYDSFKAKDKEFIIGCGNQGLFEKLLDLMGRKDLLEDSRFATLLERNKPENRIALGEIINDWTKNYNADELVDKILGVGVPASTFTTSRPTNIWSKPARCLWICLTPSSVPCRSTATLSNLWGRRWRSHVMRRLFPAPTTQKFTGAFSACPASGFGSFPKKASFKTSDQFFRSVLTFRRRLTNAF